jgi:ferredoxin/flavodoxin---NADP+ reductase
MQPEEFDLGQTERVGIIGNGNIACDMSRILLRNVDDLRTSDAPKTVIDHLARSNVHCIEMIGRRGIA